MKNHKDQSDRAIRDAQRLRLRRFWAAVATYSLVIIAYILVERLGLGGMTRAQWFIYVAAAVIGNGVFFLLFYTNTNLRFSDPSLTREQIIYAAFISFIPLYAMPAARPIIFMFFIIAFSFGMLRLTLRQYLFVTAWVMILYASLLFFEYFQGRPGFHLQYELFLFVLVGILLTWFAFFGGFISQIRQKLHTRNKELQEAQYVIRSELEERKRTEQLLRQERERLWVLLESSPFGMLLIDKGGRFTYANPKFTEIFGYTLDDTPDGNTWLTKAYPDPTYRKQVIETWLADLQTHQTGEKRSRIFDVCAKNGRKKVINFIPVLLSSGENLLVCEDITARLKLEDDLRQAQKMESIGILAGGVAHEFNNLLQTIGGYTEFILMKKDTADPDYANLKTILKAVEKAASLVRQLLWFARKAVSERRIVDVNKELAEAIELVKKTAGTGVHIEFHPDESLRPIKADAAQIRQVMLNLGDNALAAMPQGGILTIKTEMTTLTDETAAMPSGHGKGDFILITVSDTGRGMDEETVKRIFDPFFTTKAVGQGPGLGLPAVYGIVLSHGGRIFCDSTPGKGTTFKIYLPALESGQS